MLISQWEIRTRFGFRLPGWNDLNLWYFQGHRNTIFLYQIWITFIFCPRFDMYLIHGQTLWMRTVKLECMWLFVYTRAKLAILAYPHIFGTAVPEITDEQKLAVRFFFFAFLTCTADKMFAILQSIMKYIHSFCMF